VRLGWAGLIERAFEIDLEHCPNCGGELKIIAAILVQPAIQKILTHLGLQAPCAAERACSRVARAGGAPRAARRSMPEMPSPVL
jgi:hypothetical protein